MTEEIRAKPCPRCNSDAVKRVGHSVYKCLKCYNHFSGSNIVRRVPKKRCVEEEE